MKNDKYSESIEFKVSKKKKKENEKYIFDSVPKAKKYRQAGKILMIIGSVGAIISFSTFMVAAAVALNVSIVMFPFYAACLFAVAIGLGIGFYDRIAWRKLEEAEAEIGDEESLIINNGTLYFSCALSTVYAQYAKHITEATDKLIFSIKLKEIEDVVYNNKTKKVSIKGNFKVEGSFYYKGYKEERRNLMPAEELVVYDYYTPSLYNYIKKIKGR